MDRPVLAVNAALTKSFARTVTDSENKMKLLDIADLFCGGGGTTTGACEAIHAFGRQARVTAINHWDVAIETHTANHPGARHLCTSLDNVDPRKLYKPGQLYGLWASPECTGHSKARGGVPSSDQSRATAHCVIRWAEALLPIHIWVENVPEFLEWGPLGTDGRPLKSRKGDTFRAWVGMLRSLGYKVEWRVLRASDYGDPTTRQRLFVSAVRGRRRIVWPDRTHASIAELAKLDVEPELCFAPRIQRPNLKPWGSARDEIIDWDLKGRWLDEMPGKKKYGGLPLSPKTLRRNLIGLQNFGLTKSFIVSVDHASSTGSSIKSVESPLSTVTSKQRHCLVDPYLIEMRGTDGRHVKNSGRSTKEPLGTVTAGGIHHSLIEPFIVQTAHGDSGGTRARSIDQPLNNVCGNRGDMALLEPHLLPQQSGGRLRPVSEPCPTVCTAGAIALLDPFLIKFYGTATAANIDDPLDTVTTKERFGLVEPELIKELPHLKDRPAWIINQILPRIWIDGVMYRIRMRWRMLQPHELQLAQGFPKSYKFSGNKTEIVKQIGNAVPRRLARAIVFASLQQDPNVSALN